MGSKMCCLLSLMLTLLLQESVLGQQVLQVQFIRYENSLNLEFRPNNPDGPFCCCNMAFPCSSSIDDFMLGNCTAQCGLRITICAQSHADGSMPVCHVSGVETSPALVDFTSSAPLFQEDGNSRLSLDFLLDDSFTRNFSLVVTMEEEAANSFDLIDVVTIAIDGCRLSAPEMRYIGMHNIARVTLAYIIATTSESYRDCVEPNVVTDTVVETQTETERMTTTERIIERTTVTNEVVVRTVDPLAVQTAEDSTSPWKPLAIVLIVILGLAMLVAIIIIVASCFILTRRSRKTKEVNSYNPVNEEAGVSTPPKQDVAGDEVVPGIFTNLSEEILAAVPSLDEIEEPNPDTDSFTSGGEPTVEQPSALEEEPQETKAEVYTEQNGYTEDPVPTEGLYAFEK